MTRTGVTRTRPAAKSLSDFQVSVGNEGVLRTVGSKRTFADFSSARKVGRRRQNTKRDIVEYRQKRKLPSAVFLLQSAVKYKI